MKFYLTEYAVNKKNAAAIVYPSLCGPAVFLTKDFFENDQEFTYWKKISDEDYRVSESAERFEATHTVSMSSVLEISTISPSVEQMLFDQLDADSKAKELQSIMELLCRRLTCKQLRRYLLHVVGRKPQKRIAALEKVSPSAVAKSIRQVRRQITIFRNS